MSRKGRGTIGGVGLAAIAAVVLLASGCGYGSVATAANHPDQPHGGVLFAQKCAACHTLQAAGSQGTIGPDLDNAFAGDRAQGYDSSTIDNLVLDQIRLGSGPLTVYTKQSGEHGVKGMKELPGMPANLYSGQDAIDVAYYVSQVAGIAGYVKQVDLATLTTGADIFKLGPCAGCHTLAAAGTHGKIGPNLDNIKGLTLAKVSSQVTKGSANMPAFKGTLTDAQIQAVAQYVSSVAGK